MAAYSGVIARSVSDDAIPANNESYPYRIVKNEGIKIVRLRDLLAAVIEDSHQGISKSLISLRFHNTVARIIDEMSRLIADETGITQVSLTAGYFRIVCC